jgi:nucleotide-binding universal stress UspA family protein
VDLATRTGAKLHVAHAWQCLPQRASYPTVLWTDHAHLYEREARRVLEAAVKDVEALGGREAETHLLQEPPVDAVLDLCEELEPGLVVLGSRGLGPLRRLLVGSVSEGVVHHARCPVLVARCGEEAWPPGRVIVGDDGSDEAGRAAELATRIGKLFGADVALVRTHRNPPEPICGWSADDRRRLNEARLREEEALEKRAKGLQEILGSRLETKVVEGDAALNLLTVTEEGDEEKALIAVGSRGLGAIRRLRLGSVSTNVLRVAGGPVLVCPNAGQEAAGPGAEQAATVRPSGVIS